MWSLSFWITRILLSNWSPFLFLFQFNVFSTTSGIRVHQIAPLKSPLDILPAGKILFGWFINLNWFHCPTFFASTSYILWFCSYPSERWKTTWTPVRDHYSVWNHHLGSKHSMQSARFYNSHPLIIGLWNIKSTIFSLRMKEKRERLPKVTQLIHGRAGIQTFVSGLLI